MDSFSIRSLNTTPDSTLAEYDYCDGDRKAESGYHLKSLPSSNNVKFRPSLSTPDAMSTGGRGDINTTDDDKDNYYYDDDDYGSVGVGDDGGVDDGGGGVGDDDGGGNDDGGDDDCHYVNKERISESRRNIILLSVFCILISIGGPFLLKKYVNSCQKENLESSFKELMAKFPEQDTRLWATLRAVVAEHVNRPVGVLLPPTVLLLSPVSSISSFETFVYTLETFVGRLVCGKCLRIDLKSQQHATSAKLKKYLYYQIEKYYVDNGRCFHISGVDKLPGDAAVVLHNSMDQLNSPYKDAIFILSISDLLLPSHLTETFRRKLDTHLRQSIHSLWDADLGNEETSAIISRITGRIGFVT